MNGTRVHDSKCLFNRENHECHYAKPFVLLVEGIYLSLYTIVSPSYRTDSRIPLIPTRPSCESVSLWIKSR